MASVTLASVTLAVGAATTVAGVGVALAWVSRRALSLEPHSQLPITATAILMPTTTTTTATP